MSFSKILFIFVFLNFSFLWAASEVVVRAKADKATVTTGDVVTFTVEMEHDKNIAVEIPDVGRDILGFRIVDFGQTDSKEVEGQIVLSRWYKLRADMTGSYILPAVNISYKDKKGVEQKVATAEIFIEVASVLKGKEAEGFVLKDIKELRKLSSIWRWWQILLVVLILIGVLVSIYWFRRKQVKVEEVISIPPHQWARQELAKLAALDLLMAGECKRYSFALSDIMRKYFENVFSLSVTDMTIEEIKKSMRGDLAIDNNLKKEFLEILQMTDVVKFTDSKLSQEEGVRIMKQATAFVESTTLKEVVEEESVV
ncbi:MAG: hypothetical protein A2504_01620 [Bdellovibrionales bacterium RIFOXYD12_FULL_39_22]|nr:MAG: hypothetical protein A2385_04145 [Bdellovibrionales bacterium RIFOXYB1_FULL_39_21]OFZ42395.1 MAG: hypothetical protein A2485_15350 [Bdellovibrionales bacterium RIFOXYC12_FULL_39_17]OFZ46304.1 MAG: hypothetical protein A2404_13665 [Bdellovibrionales bacterium RIFOXYC1_FULL_39_130]OFZ75197.1 MAG: hypothetical protein A2560_15720 [Bdellovibrionales bacterium RIFOXYD1_FULL_39_84]OFZ93191.1 MAG: hypothetical protein A2504_01620 [Bdellovibrionales bacterium RIFOXYD12_FULL_39_22]HLE11098.1 Ba